MFFLSLQTSFILSEVSTPLSISNNHFWSLSPFLRCMISSQTWTESVPDAEVNHPGVLNAHVISALMSAVFFSMQGQYASSSLTQCSVTSACSPYFLAIMIRRVSSMYGHSRKIKVVLLVGFLLHVSIEAIMVFLLSHAPKIRASPHPLFSIRILSEARLSIASILICRPCCHLFSQSLLPRSTCRLVGYMDLANLVWTPPFYPGCPDGHTELLCHEGDAKIKTRHARWWQFPPVHPSSWQCPLSIPVRIVFCSDGIWAT